MLGAGKSDTLPPVSGSHEIGNACFADYMEICTQCPPLNVSHSLCYGALADGVR